MNRWGRRLWFGLACLGFSLCTATLSVFFSLFLRGVATRADFLGYYVGARIIAAGQPARLYDLALQLRFQDQVLGAIGEPGHVLPLAFVNPPFLGLMLSPLGRLDYQNAYLTWAAVNLVCLAGAVFFMVRGAGLRGLPAWAVAGLCAAAIPISVTLFQGQSTGLAALGVGLAYWNLKRGRQTLAGLSLGLCLVKPHLILLLPIMLLSRHLWRAAAGMAAAVIVLGLISVIFFGPSIWIQYAQLTLPQATGLKQSWVFGNKTSYTLLGLLTFLHIGPWLRWAGWLLALGVATIRLAWRPGTIGRDYAFALAGSLVLAPHANLHDLSLAALGGVAAVGEANSAATWLAGGGFWLLLLVSIALNPLLVAAGVLAWAIWLGLRSATWGQPRATAL